MIDLDDDQVDEHTLVYTDLLTVDVACLGCLGEDATEHATGYAPVYLECELCGD